LFGRKIKQAEAPLDLIEILRLDADDELAPRRAFPSIMIG
jgi:hypothetical protein